MREQADKNLHLILRATPVSPTHTTCMLLVSTSKRWAIWIAIAALALLGLWCLAPVLTPFLIAAVLAYALNPVVNRIDDLVGGRMPRMVGVLLVELVFVVIVLGVLLLVVPILTQELPLMRDQVPALLERGRKALLLITQKVGIKLALDTSSLQAQLLKYLNANWDDVLTSLLSSIKLGGSLALALVGNAVLVPVALFYLLLDWKKFVTSVVELVPLPLRPSYDSFMDEADLVLGQYLRGLGVDVRRLGVVDDRRERAVVVRADQEVGGAGDLANSPPEEAFTFQAECSTTFRDIVQLEASFVIGGKIFGYQEITVV